MTENKPREPWLYNYPETRAWIYRVLSVVLLIVAGWQGFEAVSSEHWILLIGAILNVSGSVGFIAAQENTPK